MLTKLLGLRPLLKELRGIRQALEMGNKIAAMQLNHDTGQNVMIMLETPKPHAKDESTISTPDFAYISRYQAAESVLTEQLGRQPSESEVLEILDPQAHGVPS